MPIQKVPVLHKFGIVSVTHKEDLERRVKEKVLLEKSSTKESSTENREVTYHVTEDFVHRFNASDKIERSQLEKEAKVFLSRVKRRTGIRDAGVGSHVDLGEGWKELILLAVCESQSLQDEALASLYTSLYYSPISRRHAKSLLEVAKHCLGWLKASAIAQAYLRTGEIKLLKIAHLVFVRIYYHNLAGDLTGAEETVAILRDLLEGFSQQLLIYKPFPSVLLSMQFLVAIGKVLTQGLTREKSKTNVDFVYASGKDKDVVSSNDPRKADEQECETDPRQLYPTKNSRDDENLGSGDDSYVNVSLHSSSPCLWHALNLWRNVSHTEKGIEGSVNDLLNCQRHQRQQQNWLYDILALLVFSEAAAIDASVMDAFQEFAFRKLPAIIPSARQKAPKKDSQGSPDPIIHHPPSPVAEPRSDDSFLDSLQKLMSLSSVQNQIDEVTSSPLEKCSSHTQMSCELESIQLKTENAVTGCMKKNMCASSDRLEYKEAATERLWDGQIIVAYLQCLGKLCVQGRSSKIRKLALQGDDKSHVGLIQFLDFRILSEDGEDLAWEVRHVAVLELVKVVTWYTDDVLNEGMKNAAWTALLKHKSREVDARVLEAVKISRIEAEIERCCHVEASHDNIDVQSINSRVSTNFAIIMLPPLHQPLQARNHNRESLSRKQLGNTDTTKPNKNYRITIGDDIMLNQVAKPRCLGRQEMLWHQMQLVAATHYENEVLADEGERQIHREKQVEKELQKIVATPRKALRQRVK